MGTLLIMMASIGLMSGCGHTTRQIALAPPTAPAPVAVPLTPDGSGDEEQKPLVVVTEVPKEPPPCRTTSAASQTTDQKPKKPCPKKNEKRTPKRWIPEPIAPPSYLNAGGMAPHPYMMRALR